MYTNKWDFQVEKVKITNEHSTSGIVQCALRMPSGVLLMPPSGFLFMCLKNTNTKVRKTKNLNTKMWNAKYKRKTNEEGNAHCPAALFWCHLWAPRGRCTCLNRFNSTLSLSISTLSGCKNTTIQNTRYTFIHICTLSFLMDRPWWTLYSFLTDPIQLYLSVCHRNTTHKKLKHKCKKY